MHLAKLLTDQPQLHAFIQHDMRPEDLGQELLALLDDPRRVLGMVEQYSRIRPALRRNASQVTAVRMLQETARGAQHGQ